MQDSQTSNSKNNKQKLIEVAIDMIRSKGFEGSGISELLEKAAVTRSNFYYHFDSKETLFLEALDVLFQQHITFMVEPTLLNLALTPRVRLEHFLDKLEALMNQSACNIGCPFVNLASETSAVNESFRQKLLDIMSKQEAVLVSCYQSGVACGDFRADILPEQAATFILATIKGTMVLTKTRKSTRDIQSNRKTLFHLFSTS
jgi:TetR/AcrR family transcriptional regulator, transcriptional repressor for nem operon